MSTVQEIESAIVRLSRAEQEQLQAWFEEWREDQLQVSDKFQQKIRRAQEELAGGMVSRTRTPGS